jgi:hypothetical protein
LLLTGSTLPSETSPASPHDRRRASGTRSRTRRYSRKPQRTTSPWHELTTRRASLEEAFMELTRDSVDYHAGAPADMGKVA